MAFTAGRINPVLLLMAPPWAGDSVLMGGDSLVSFFNAAGEAIILQPQAKPGESWTMYQSSSLIIEANVTHWDTLTLLGILDSVKYIRLDVKDNNQVSILHDLSGKEIWLSKDQGLIQLPSWGLFPEDSQMYRLTNIEKLRYRDVYSWSVGDEYQLVQDRGFSTEYKLYSILEKDTTQSGDSIYYKIAAEYYLLHPDFPDGRHTYDTLEPWYGVDMLEEYIYERLPEELFSVGDSLGEIDFYYMEAGQDNRRILKPDVEFSINSAPGVGGMSDSCYFTSLDGEFETHRTAYIEGIGALNVIYGPFASRIWERLVYYDIGWRSLWYAGFSYRKCLGKPPEYANGTPILLKLS